ncbi:hypothetical protein [Cylindrospermopsis raciborskii]|uniref:hypothetical protein n=1 Tax=Cylindrospermopsis raciborskii TaxID=77022 RepID=UPI00115D0226|nr:hypothetical protein [Cylindrospermopsis raciborskii]MCZ2207631.1 hypothetical protein [Cylindrospermopsis raciborskii PAMP2011]
MTQTTQLSNTLKQPQPQNIVEPIKDLLIGSKKTVYATIHQLHVLGYAHATDWSDLVPTANPGEFMSVLKRQLVIQ